MLLPPARSTTDLLSIISVILCVTFVGQAQVWDPPAISVWPDHNDSSRSQAKTHKLIAEGKLLFETRFNALDGAGRPSATGDSKPTFRSVDNNRGFTRTSGPDANSCSACHNQPAIGGSGDFVANVFVGAQFRDPPTTSITTDVTSERNTITMFGSGAIDMLAREMTRDLLAQRDKGLSKAKATNQDQPIALKTKGIFFGTIVVRPDGSYETSRLEGVDPDLIVKPFGAKGISISLREFTINALNHHHGIQAVERFGWEQTGQRDFDSDGVNVEFTVGQVSALVLFQASLPAAGRAPSFISKHRRQIERGSQLFKTIGCGDCHVPFLNLSASHFSEPNPYNRPGNINPKDVGRPLVLPLPIRPNGGLTRSAGDEVLVWAFTDLKRHRICDDADPFFCNENLRQDNVPTDQFMTTKLWDLATSAPYGHRGDCTTISEAIIHHSAEGAGSRNNFLALNDNDKRSLIRFLLSLGTAHYVQ